MLNEEVFFKYFWKIFNLLGFNTRDLKFYQKFIAFLMLLMYIYNTCYAVIIAIMSDHKGVLKARMEFLLISTLKITEMVYIAMKSQKIKEMIVYWSEFMFKHNDKIHFIKGKALAMRINKVLLIHVTFTSLILPIRLLITGNSNIAVRIPSDFLSFIGFWLFQSWFIIYGALVSFTMDVLVFYNFFMFESYSKVISDLLKKFNLKEIHKLYNEYLNYFKEFNEIFSNIALMRGMSMAIGCVILVVYMINENTSRDTIIGIFSFLVIMSCKFFIPCYLGSNIEYASQNFIKDIFYEVDWIKGDKNLRENLKITQECFKRPNKLMAVKIFHINLESFLRVMNFSFSAYALLNHINYSI
ncbi:hypothetical protein PVAND_012243 [Polypedilum vanderplanki]|uniref:Odorant receptor n=1 Tax=Polypedilum vanderplanki TaxID=319348 RepID=A0A9J6CLT7_POLVA|nr:hypothetical protein PVAND_012243 [Polypedilum vanderplanki]